MGRDNNIYSHLYGRHVADGGLRQKGGKKRTFLMTVSDRWEDNQETIQMLAAAQPVIRQAADNYLYGKKKYPISSRDGCWRLFKENDRYQTERFSGKTISARLTGYIKKHLLR